MAPTAHELITKTVLDYYEGWYDADVGRMDRAVHNDLVKPRSAVARRPPQGLCGSLASFAEKMERGRSCIGTRIR